MVIDDVVALLVEAAGQRLFGNRHADGIGDALAERTGGGLDARGIAVFRVTRGLGVQLAEVFQLFDRQVVAGQMQQRIDQHRAVAVGEHEAVAIRPLRIGRVVSQEIVPQYLGDIGHAHRRAGVAGVGLLHGIHAEGANGIGQIAAAGESLFGFGGHGCFLYISQNSAVNKKFSWLSRWPTGFLRALYLEFLLSSCRALPCLFHDMAGRPARCFRRPRKNGGAFSTTPSVWAIAGYS